ncbi:protein LOL1 isoform X2 [Vigna angularis]|uniref:protein LOL1 isoform X2 n=1 Tax=Phaseolus angularis TaxID=3914 RepID=UPI00080A6A35|nr:protein LOL1 isoform X2 [Vigna angularis]
MPVPLAPYPAPPAPYTPPANGAQSQLVCSGCRNLLMYPVGATSVCCAVCNAVTAVPPPGTEMAQLVCGGCHTLLMYIRGATNVQCSCCHTVNLALEVSILRVSIKCVLNQQIRWHMSTVGTAGCYSCTNMEQDP